MAIDSKISIPSWLETPPLGETSPPVETRQQELPFGELTWENFEKLCLRLARLEANVESCYLYGERGDNQQGIDIFARKQLSAIYTVYQCKREKEFGPAKIKSAILKFLEGNWVNKTNTFVLCTQESLRSQVRTDEFETQETLLREQGITLLRWDSDELSEKLKKKPKLVDDFFGRAWVAKFCGEEQAENLGKRLDNKNIGEFRSKLAVFYKRVFNTHDPGIPIITLDISSPLSLEDRYVLPDINERYSVNIPFFPEVKPQESEPVSLENSRAFNLTTTENSQFEDSKREVSSVRSYVAYEQRQSITKWLAAKPCSIVLGGPGSGKSTLLRFLAIDLLQESPQLSLLAEKWSDCLPIWIPFALWTKMIHDSHTCSLSDVVQGWLNSWEEKRLWPLVEQALADERLLLLVDGLDEWKNEASARIALERLQVFVEQRNIPAIVTSRPHGFDRLGIQKTAWQIGFLSDFSPSQQQKLSQIWFTFRNRSLLSGSKPNEDDDIKRTSELDTENFIIELNKSVDIRDLSKVPLLLCLLISLKFRNAVLPQNRFKAYDALVEYLISTHPQKRKTSAAVINETFLDLSDEDFKKIIAQLAYHIQENFREGVIEQEEAIKTVETYLKDPDGSFGFEQPDARKFSRAFLNVGENTIGLLVKQSPKEIGLFHRAFLEYLAAYHLSRLSLQKQVTMVETYCADPQWREVILGLFQITNRSEDIKQLVGCIQKKINNISQVDKYAVELLLSETAFGEFNCSASLAKKIASEVFENIELGFWMPHRERLLHHVLDGLRSAPVKELVKSKLQSWFPSRRRWRSNIFYAMTNWPLTDEVITYLWRGIHDEEIDNQRAAAKTLANLAAGNVEIGNRLACLACSPSDPKTRAVAVESLLYGWPNHESLERILGETRYSISPELRLVAILGRIQQHNQTEEDQEELLRLGSREGQLNYEWPSEVAKALMNGWPQSSITKEACFDALQKDNISRSKLDGEIALRILLEDYPQDADVAQFCVEQFRHENYPFLEASIGYQIWILLAQNFKDHPQLVAVIDEWILKQTYHEPEVAIVAMVGRTPTAKAKLLSSLDSQFPHWSAEALIEGWGIQDTEVAQRLRQIAFSSAAEASKIGHLLPQIIEDKTVCRNRLLEVLQNPNCERPDIVMSGLAILGSTQGDTEVVDIVLNLISKLNRNNTIHELVIKNLFLDYSSDERVRELAKRELLEGNDIYSIHETVVLAYGSSLEIRQKIIEVTSPLPVRLRWIIAKYLGEGGNDQNFAMSLLKFYDHDHDLEVKTQASISYHTLLKASDQDLAPALEILSKNIVDSGIRKYERRQAAFCGLVLLGRLDIVVNAKEYNGQLCTISINNAISLNAPLLKHIIQNWDAIKAALGNELWSRFSRNKTTSQLDIWDRLSIFAHEYPSPRNELLQFLEHQTERNTNSNILRFLDKVCPKSSLLLEYCLNTLDTRAKYSGRLGQEEIVAAQLLGENFGGDQEVLNRIIAGADLEDVSDKIIVALCEGWTESQEFAFIFERVSRDPSKLTYAAYFKIICRKQESDLVFHAIIQVISRTNYYNRLLDQSSIIQRLRKDDSLLEMLFSHLQANPTPSSKATIPKIIASARNLSPELRDWCIEEANYQLSSIKTPEIGIDWISGGMRPVVHSLLDILITGVS
ncbi:putative NTPase (NACHT family) [Cylindrospermum stagnale PCC 7417]|uniref:Putative NTPase (NACHT family) n=1 Tax=Cylindrospermum stagnale PCC 7417 TaxID=56107 RepID=K9X442_9NOST|nr:NACHT domain-containing protein [Cylindrospermum stagnale]AFZ27223.1 putative NTPase (NACHT family) [Cylindrospermum stagnale PCC 7417]